MTSTQPTLVRPHLFRLQGYNTEVFLSGSLNGTPQLAYTNRGQTLSFSGSEILTEQTQLGEMLTVSLSDNLALGDFESLTLLIPAVRTSGFEETSIQTIAIFNRRSRVESGQSQTYMTLCLAGTAQQVNF